MKSKSFKKLLGLGIAALTIAAISGCSAGSSGSSTSTSASGGRTVGIAMADLSNPVWAQLVTTAKQYGASKGLQISDADAKDSSDTQVSQIEDFIQKGDKAIIVCAVESSAVEDVLKQARAKGIKVVGYTQVLKNVDTQYLVNPYKTGYANGEAAGKWVKKTFGNAPIEWGLMNLPQSPQLIQRANGIQDAVKKYAPNAKLVATAPALNISDGVSNAETFLQAHPNMKMIATIGGGGAGGAVQGVRSAGITDFKKFGIFGIDSTQPEIKDIMANGPEKSTISLGGGKEHGKKLIDMALDELNGKKISKDIYMPITAINSSNAAAFNKENFG